jgi:hypothetical protein
VIGTAAEAKAQRPKTLERAPGKGPWRRKKMSRRNHFVGTLAVAAGILAAGGMLALMTLVVKVGPAAATPQQIIAYAEVGTSDTAKNSSSDIVLWIRSSNGYRRG